MSRCLPYPPPGYIGKIGNEALIESIKLRKEKEKAKTERKEEKKREKKEERRGRKENKETSKLTSTGVSHGKSSNKGEKSCTQLKGESTNKRKHEDAEQLERSGITEEHGQPLSLQNPSYSSDSTQNSNKRRKQDLPLDVNASRGHGNILRIRLPSKKHNEPAVSGIKEQIPSILGREMQAKASDISVGKEQLCSTSGRMDLPVHCGHNLGRRTSQGELSLIAPAKELSFFLDDNQIASGFGPGSTSRNKKKQKKALHYDKLIQSLVPPPLMTDNDDEDWLFGGNRHSDRNVEKKLTPCLDVVGCRRSGALQPRARYLAEAEVYALPFTVPF